MTLPRPARRLLTADEAADYLGYGGASTAFRGYIAKIGVKPVRPGVYDRVAIDLALDAESGVVARSVFQHETGTPEAVGRQTWQPALDPDAAIAPLLSLRGTERYTAAMAVIRKMQAPVSAEEFALEDGPAAPDKPCVYMFAAWIDAELYTLYVGETGVPEDRFKFHFEKENLTARIRTFNATIDQVEFIYWPVDSQRWRRRAEKFILNATGAILEARDRKSTSCWSEKGLKE